jgi:hypothetical protein
MDIFLQWIKGFKIKFKNKKKGYIVVRRQITTFLIYNDPPQFTLNQMIQYNK